MSEIASELPSAFAGPAERPAPAASAAAPAPAAPAPAPAEAPAEPDRIQEAGDTPWSDGFAFLVTVALQSARATLEAVGFGHPTRIPIALVVWLVTTIFLGLPTVNLTQASWETIFRYGNWTHASWVAATVEISALFIVQVLRSGPLVSKARHRVPQLGVQALLARGEALYWTEVQTAEGLKDWMDQVKAWTQECERELTETISAAAADAFRRPSVIQVYKHRQRFNDAHNGWLDLLSKRLDALRDLSRGFKHKSKRFVQDPEPGR
jgi:hypothetical protein